MRGTLGRRSVGGIDAVVVVHAQVVVRDTQPIVIIPAVGPVLQVGGHVEGRDGIITALGIVGAAGGVS